MFLIQYFYNTSHSVLSHSFVQGGVQMAYGWSYIISK